MSHQLNQHDFGPDPFSGYLFFFLIIISLCFGIAGVEIYSAILR